MDKLKYIYGTSVIYTNGASPNYKLSVTKSLTQTTSWNVSGSLSGEFNIKVVKTKLQASAGYSSTNMISINSEILCYI